MTARQGGPFAESPGQSDRLEPEAPRPSRDGTRTARWAWIWAVGLVVCSGVLESLKNTWVFWALVKEWAAWLAMLQIGGMSVIVAVFGIPRRARGILLFLLANLLLAGTIAGHFTQAFATWWFGAVEFVVKFGWAAVWVWALLGWSCVLACVLAARRRRRCPDKVVLGAKVWLAAAVTLLAAEPVCQRLVRTQITFAFPTGLAEPDADELRIASIGGSTMLGYPYEPKFGIPHVAAWRLQASFPHKRLVVENLAIGGHNLERAIDELKHLSIRPHVLLVYTGHNEFVHDVEEMQLNRAARYPVLDRWMLFSPTYEYLSTWATRQISIRDVRVGTRALAESAWSTPLVLNKRLERFRTRLRKLAEFCRQERIEALWFIPTASESVFEPSRSAISPRTDKGEIRWLEEQNALGRRLLENEDWPAAAAHFQGLLAEYPTFAEFHFQLAESLMQLDRPDDAREHYAAALENDGFPTRALVDYRRCIAEVAREHSIPVVDASAVLRPHTAEGILDDSLFHDNVHLKLEGYALLGCAAAEQIYEGLLEAGTDSSNPLLACDVRAAIAASGLQADDLAIAYERMAGTMKFLAQLRFDRQRRSRQAERFLKWSRGLKDGSLQPGEQGTESLD